MDSTATSPGRQRTGTTPGRARTRSFVSMSDAAAVNGMDDEKMDE